MSYKILWPKKRSLSSERNNFTFRAYQLGPFLTEADRAALRHGNVFNSLNIHKIGFDSSRQGWDFSLVYFSLLFCSFPAD